MDIVGYGDADVDIFLSVDHLPARDEKVLAKNYSFHEGGMVANTVVALSRLGRSVGFHGRIGDDAFGRMALANLEENKVDTRGVIVKPDGHTFFCVVLVDSSGEKALVSAPTDCRERHPADISEEYIAEARHLHTTAIFMSAATKAINIAKKHGLTVSLDVDAGTAKQTKKLWALLSKVDLLFINKRGACLLGDSDSIEVAAYNLVNRGAKIVCVTLGKEGSFTATADRSFSTKAFDVEVVDTTGAGDCFAAGFIHGFFSNWPLDYVTTFASAVSAISIKSFGGHTGSPTLKEVLSFLRGQEVVSPLGNKA